MAWFTYPCNFKYWGKNVSFNPIPYGCAALITPDCIPMNQISQERNVNNIISPKHWQKNIHNNNKS